MNGKMDITIYTDGGCSPNPGLGTYAWLMIAESNGKILKTCEHFGAHPFSTNQRMELTAVITALQALTRSTEASVISDSEYVVKGMNEWLPKWKSNGWRSSSKKPVLNKDLWQQLDDLILLGRHTIRFEWTRGHANNSHNNRVDELCQHARKLMTDPDSGYIWIRDMTSNGFFIEKYDNWMLSEFDNPRNMDVLSMVTHETAVKLAKKE